MFIPSKCSLVEYFIVLLFFRCFSMLQLYANDNLNNNSSFNNNNSNKNKNNRNSHKNNSNNNNCINSN